MVGNPTRFILTKDGETVHNLTYEYDTLHRLRKVQQNGRGRVVYTYDKNGNRATMRYATGSITTYTYNKANWVTGITAVTGSTVLSNYSYTYYADGNRKSETDSISGTQTTYVYDDLGRLTQESETGGLTVNYSYNAAGNRTQMAVSGTETYTTTYTYDANNRLTRENKTQGTTTSTTLYTYDDNGNLLRKGTVDGAELYEYNGFNQLVILKQGDGGASYGYNASGIRVSKNADDTYTYFLLDGGNVVAECTNDALSAVYLRGINLVYRDTASGTEYYLHDAHGDIVALTNSSGAVTKRYAYDAFGNEVNPSDSDSNPFRYCGEYFDKETGSYYLRARYYDPAIGRFTQQDTHWSPANMIYGDNPRKIYERQDALGLSICTYAPEITAIMQSGNLYVYCVSNPVAYIDPLGELTWPGEIHNQVVNHVASTNKLYKEQWIIYSSGFGRADLISPSGEVWDVKRDKEKQIAAGVKQVKKYTENKWLLFQNIQLSVGGWIAGGEFIYHNGESTYRVWYRYAGNGIIAYDYEPIVDWQTIGEVTVAIALFAGTACLIYFTCGSAAPAMIALLM